MKNISEHISYKEAIKSQTALSRGIANIPSSEQLQNMQVLAEKVFEPLRHGLGDYPINVSSFYRSKQLNNLIGGSNNSQHMCNNGAAMDIDNDRYQSGPTNEDIFYYILEKLDFDQVIAEFPDIHGISWVHVSYVSPNRNRRESLIATQGNKGHTIYLPFTKPKLTSLLSL